MFAFRACVKKCVWVASKYLGIFYLCRHYTASGLRILCYHGIWDTQPHFGDALFMRPETFAERLRILKEKGYPVLLLDEALEQLNNEELPKHAVVITIDDGWYGTYEHMLPALEEHGFPATLYMTTYYSEHQIPVTNVVIRLMLEKTTCRTLDLSALPLELDGSWPLTSEAEVARGIANLTEVIAEADISSQVQFCVALGKQLGIDYTALACDRQLNLMDHSEIVDAHSRNLDIQLHTHRHRTSHRGQHTLASEITTNRQILERLTGNQLKHFCYPSGLYDSVQDWPVLAQEGIRSATTCELGFNYQRNERFGLKRILDAQSVSALEFEGELCGFGELLRALRLKIGLLRI